MVNTKTLAKIDYNQIKAIAISQSKKFQKPEMTDDFIQFACEALIQGRKATVAQLFVDFLRLEYGDARREYKKDFNFNRSVEFEETMLEPTIDQHNLDFTNIVNKFEGIERSILILHFVWGMNLKEIGYAVGLSESSISLKFTDINKRLVKNYGHA